MLVSFCSAIAEGVPVAAVSSTPEAALALASSPAAFARVAGESRLASYPGQPAVADVATLPASSAPANSSADTAEASTSALPETPQPVNAFTADSGVFTGDVQQTSGHTPHYSKYVAAGWTADPITAHDKVIIGARDLYSVSNFLAIFASAGYEHVSNGSPNYGTNSKAFGQRVGAAAVRETSQGIFTDMVFSPLLHQDPRYFQKGPQYNFFQRTLYAITRPLVTRTDSGHSTVNASLLLGYAGAAALTPAYYPQINRNFRDVASTYGGSIGGAALGFFVSEFTDDLLRTLHMKK